MKNHYHFRDEWTNLFGKEHFWLEYVGGGQWKVVQETPEWDKAPHKVLCRGNREKCDRFLDELVIERTCNGYV